MTGTACVGLGACSSSTTDDFEDPGLEDAGDPDTGSTFDSGRDVNRPPRDARADSKDTGTGGDAGADARGSDADAGDARKDAADAFAETGSSCSPLNAVQTRKCGLCGQQQRVCIDPEAEDGGNLSWQEWGACLGEVDGGCVPGTTRDAGCGKCGTMNQTCSNACLWPTSGACKNEGPCWPGDIDSVLSLSCDAGLVRERECESTCTWTTYGACEIQDETLTIPTTIGGRVAKRYHLGQEPQIGYSSFWSNGTCGSTSWNSNDTYPPPPANNQYAYALVQLKNPTAKEATVSVWTYAATGAGALTPNEITIRALRNRPPVENGGYFGEGMTDCAPDWTTYCCNDTTTDPTACVGGCSSSPYWGGLMNAEGNAVKIPANSSVWLFVQDLYDYSHLTGDIMIGVKTHSL
jgi:hypothetical protein